MKQAGILGGLLAVALIGAYWSWTHPEEENAKLTDIVAVRADVSTLTSVTWREEKKVITMTRPHDAAGDYVWFEVSESVVDKSKPPEEAPPVEEPPAAPEDATDTDTKPAPEPPPRPMITTVTRFEGSAQAADLWKAFTPLYALREVVAPKGEGLEPYGLDKPKATIEVVMSSGTLTLQVGGETYGTRDRYVGLDGKIYLIDDEVLRPLEFAKSRLVERGLFPLEEKDITSISVKSGQNARVFSQKNADDRPKAFWADATAPDERDVEATTWLGKLFRVRVKDYVPAADAPKDAKVVFAYEVKGAKEAWTVAVVSAEKDGVTEYYAQSSYNRSVVSLTRSLAEEAIADLGALFDGKKVEEEEAAPAGDPAAPPSPIRPPIPTRALPEGH